MDPEVKSMNTKELTHAVNTLLAREETRLAQQRRAQRRRKKRRRKQEELRIARLAKSVEVIKWCIVGITSVMVISVIVLMLVAVEVEREAEHIKLEVQRIQREAEGIRDKIRHPLESLGGNLGRRLDQRMGGLLEPEP